MPPVHEGDLILSRNEFDPTGPLEAKPVEKIFSRTGRIAHLHLGSQVIRTTLEHPFYVQNKDWLSAGELQPGDRIASHDGQWIAVEEVHDTGAYETVYNVRVADWHTYFVGEIGWGWSAWGHNACAVDFKRVSGDSASVQQLSNTDNRIFRLTDHEIEFAKRVFAAKPNLQIYRTHRTANMGDFVIVDKSNSARPVGWIVELKTASGSPHAGVQLSRAIEAADFYRLTHYRAETGSIDELLLKVSVGRGDWPF